LAPLGAGENFEVLAMLLFVMAGQADLPSPHGEKAVVLLFIRSDCPISNRYTPEFQRLYKRYSARGVEFHLVYPEPGLTDSAMERHCKEYGLTIPALLDADHKYVDLARVRVTPEVAVFVHGRLVYEGRVDDRFVDFGKTRPVATRHDLEDVLSAVAAGKSVEFYQTKAVGCAIESLQ
jgi:AhpC/TSA family protein